MGIVLKAARDADNKLAKVKWCCMALIVGDQKTVAAWPLIGRECVLAFWTCVAPPCLWPLLAIASIADSGFFVKTIYAYHINILTYCFKKIQWKTRSGMRKTQRPLYWPLGSFGYCKLGSSFAVDCFALFTNCLVVFKM